MTRSSLLLAAGLIATSVSAMAQDFDAIPQQPVLRETVQVSSEVVRIGDLVANAGAAAQIAVFRSPDLGVTGTVPADQVIQALRAHQVIGVDAKDIREVTVMRPARMLSSKDLETQIAKALGGRGIGEAANIAVKLDRGPGQLQLEGSNQGDLNPVAVRFDARNGRFDIVFEIAAGTSAPTKLRFTGQAYETVETTVLARSVDRGEVLKTADLVVERRAKADAGTDIAPRDRAQGMQMRKAVRAGQVLRNTDVSKPDLVQRDQNVSLIYQTPGLHLTMLGKALESGAEGDSINIVNASSKRVIQGVVVGPAQVLITPIGASAGFVAAAAQTDSAGRAAVTEQ